MRSFQQVLIELKHLVASHRPGDRLEFPPSLSFVNINGHRLSYVAAGLDKPADRPPVVLLHGFGGFFMDWPRVMAPVVRHTRVYALDLPGWGFSEPQPGAVSLEDEVAIIEAFMKSLGLNRVILCGISYGGGVAWAAAAMKLARLKQVILLNPMPTHPLRHMRSPLYRGIFAMGVFNKTSRMGHRLMSKSNYKQICRENLLNDRLLDTFYLDLAYLVIKQPKISALVTAHARGARLVNWQRWENRLASIRIPVTILQGLDDRVFSIHGSQVLHRLIPTSQLIEVPNCGHAMVFDQQRKVSDMIIDALTLKAPIGEILSA